MSVHLFLDPASPQCFTNLDVVSGKVVLTLPTESTISAVTVKLEAESKTRLYGQKFPGNERSDKKRTEQEIHKLLYKVVTVFPNPGIQEGSLGSQYTLSAGQHTYDFSFKFAFNNDCTRNTSLIRDLKLGQLSVQIPDVNKHKKRDLPPSLPGFSGEAEIKYFVKATVIRPKFYQENLRVQQDIKFLPIEPPREPDRQEETFARRKQQFKQYIGPPPKKNIFKKTLNQEPVDYEPPAFQIDARLPSPAIITCNEPLPLRILIQKLNESPATVFLSTLQIEMLGYTLIRAHDLFRTESQSWVLMSQANMKMPLGSPQEKSPDEWKVPSRFWDNIPLPNTVAPSFDTCNITRYYELEVRVGLSHGVAAMTRPELIVLPLRLPVSVYSGIRPPPELLALKAKQAQEAPSRITGSAIFPQSSFIPLSPITAHPNSAYPSTPIGGQATQAVFNPGMPSTSSNPNYAASVVSAAPSYSQVNATDDLPPSYEDAMAEDIAPVDGPRRQYNYGSEGISSNPSDPSSQYRPPPSPSSPQQNFTSDSKSSSSHGNLGRRVSERLFSQNAPSAPPFSRPPRASSGSYWNTTSPSSPTSSNTPFRRHFSESISARRRSTPGPPDSANRDSTAANDSIEEQWAGEEVEADFDRAYYQSFGQQGERGPNVGSSNNNNININTDPDHGPSMNTSRGSFTLNDLSLVPAPLSPRRASTADSSFGYKENGNNTPRSPTTNMPGAWETQPPRTGTGRVERSGDPDDEANRPQLPPRR